MTTSNRRMTLLLLAALVLAALPASLARPTRSAQAQITTTTALNAIACSDTSDCIAVGSTTTAADPACTATSGNCGVVLPIANGVAASLQTVQEASSLLGIACPTATTCFAVGMLNGNLEGVVVPILSGTATNGPGVLGTTTLAAIACPSTTICYAVGGGKLVPITNGTVGTAQTVTGAFLFGIACPGATTCFAVGENGGGNGLIVPISNGSPGTPTTTTTTFQFNGIACESNTMCFAVSNTNHGKLAGCPNTPSNCGVVTPITSGGLDTPQVVDQVTALWTVTCASSSTCVAAGQAKSGFAASVPVIGGFAGIALRQEPAGQFNGVACATSTACFGVGQTSGTSTGVLVALPSFIAASIQTVAGTTQLTAITCPTSSTCWAAGANSGKGVVLPIASGSPGTLQSVSSSAILSGIVCSSASACLAVGNTIDATCGTTFNICGAIVPITNSSAGSATPVPGTKLLSAIACTDSSDCIAVGLLTTQYSAACAATSGICGVVVPLTNGSPGAVQLVNDTQLNGIACPSSTTCYAVGGMFLHGSTCSSNDGECGVIVPITSGAAGTPQPDTDAQNFDAIACASAPACTVVGMSQNRCGNQGAQCGVVVPLTSGSAGTAQFVLGSFELFGVACPSSTVCYADSGDATGPGLGVVPITGGGVFGDVGVNDTTGQTGGIACTDANTCFALGGAVQASSLGAIISFASETAGPAALMSVQPASGPAAGGTPVTLLGVGFLGTTSVQFGSNAATNVRVVSNSQLTATSPSGNGTVDVSATTPAGTSAVGQAADQFSYVSCRLADVNCNNVIDATDALCVLREVASLSSTQACPIPLANPTKIATDGNPLLDATDALCILRGVAHLPMTSACPQISTP